jgi:hypothetical protein
MSKKPFGATAVLILTIASLTPAFVKADDAIETAGVATGVTVGNMWAVPLKAISMSVGALTGALSFVLTGGNADLTQQIWRDSLQGPYIITPDLAHKAVGERPELVDKQK